MAITEIGDRDFEERVLAPGVPAVVDLWAPWCGPCRMLAPRLERVAAAYADRVRFFKLNVDDHPQTPARYGVLSIPTLLFVRDGQVREQRVGLQSEEALRAALERLLAPAGTA
jgi:thioredoxin 1